jgi:cytochrome c-type biogenesis protein CcmH/NrfG
MKIMKKLLPVLGVVLWFGTTPMWAQEDETPEQKQYRQDYEVWQKIQVVKEPMKRADDLLQFMKDRPNSKLIANAQDDYLRVVQDLTRQSKWDVVVTQTERLLKVRPKVGEAYYFLGQALKEQQKLPEAMDALAKCYVLKCLASQRARQFLEVIYKGVNKGSLTGLDAIIQKARTAIGG